MPISWRSFALLGLAAAAFDVARRVRYRKHARLRSGSDHWPSTAGTIELVNVSERQYRRRRRRVFISELSYSYSAAGTFYSGHCYRAFANEQTALEVVAQCRGKTIRVRYSPDQPGLSFLAGFDGSAESESVNAGAWLTKEFFEHQRVALERRLY